MGGRASQVCRAGEVVDILEHSIGEPLVAHELPDGVFGRPALVAEIEGEVLHFWLMVSEICHAAVTSIRGRGTTMKHYAGLDVLLNETTVCIVDEMGAIRSEMKVPSHPDDSV